MALKLVEKSNIIMVDPMNEAQAMALLRKKLETLEDDQEVAELAAAFEFMPLAIVQAATYIYQRAPRCSVRQYLEKFKRSDREKMTLLDEEGGHLRRHWEAKNSILITWQISFNHIQQTRPTAANLLSLMSFFDRQGIPESLLRHRYATYGAHENVDNVNRGGDEDDQKCDDDDSSELGNSNEFEEDVLMLRNYSFIKAIMNTTAFEMHGLVQLATRKWLNADGQLERWKEQFIENLCVEFPTGEYENWAKCQALFPHVKSAVSQQPSQDDSLRKWALLLLRAASYAWRRGNVADAETMSMKAMKTRQKLFGREHEETLRSMAMTGLTYGLSGRWNDAEELQVQVMETRVRMLGAEHPNTLISKSNLASTYSEQGRWKEAEELQVQVIETMIRVRGVEHPDTLISMSNLASTYWIQGRWNKAEELQVQVMETEVRVLGAEHPDTLTSMSNMAIIWKEQGQHAKALALMEECVRLRSQVLGDKHPKTLSSSTVLTRWKDKDIEIGT